LARDPDMYKKTTDSYSTGYRIFAYKKDNGLIEEYSPIDNLSEQ
jgi:hypothetical protein